jgi:hypothetical protein
MIRLSSDRLRAERRTRPSPAHPGCAGRNNGTRVSLTALIRLPQGGAAGALAASAIRTLVLRAHRPQIDCGKDSSDKRYQHEAGGNLPLLPI